MRRLLTSLLAATAIFAACGGGSAPDPAEDPKGALKSAVEEIGNYEGTTFEITLNSDLSSLIATSEGELTEEQAQAILDSSLRMTTKEGDTPEESEFELVADIAGDLVEMRVVENVLYVRADVRDLVSRFGGSQEDIDASLQDAPPQLSFLDAAVEGEWIGAEGAEEFARQFGGLTPQDEEEAAELQKEIASKLVAAIEDNSTVTSAGSDDIGEHLEVELEVRSLAEAFFEIIRSVPGGDAFPAEAFDTSQIPDAQLPLDAWISDGRLVQIQLDIIEAAAAFEAEDPPPGVENLAILVAIEEFTDSVEAPEAAEIVNFGELFQSFMGLGAGTSSGAPAAPDLSELCAQLEGQPEEVVSQFAEECPELQQ